MTPVVCHISASVPANGPSPAANTISAAQTSSGIERKKLRMRREATRGDGPKRPAAGNASKSPRTVAMAVPIAEIAMVSSVALATRRK